MWGWRPVSGKKMESKDFDAKQKKKYQHTNCLFYTVDTRQVANQEENHKNNWQEKQ